MSPRPPKTPGKIEIEPGADKRLVNILKKALNTPPSHKPSAKPKHDRPKRGRA